MLVIRIPEYVKDFDWHELTAFGSFYAKSNIASIHFNNAEDLTTNYTDSHELLKKEGRSASYSNSGIREGFLIDTNYAAFGSFYAKSNIASIHFNNADNLTTNYTDSHELLNQKGSSTSYSNTRICERL